MITNERGTVKMSAIIGDFIAKAITVSRRELDLTHGVMPRRDEDLIRGEKICPATTAV